MRLYGQINTDGVIIQYKNDDIEYEVNYTYLFGKLVAIKLKNKSQKARSYNFFQIILARIEALILYDKTVYYGYSKEDLLLVNLYNNMLVY